MVLDKVIQYHNQIHFRLLQFWELFYKYWASDNFFEKNGFEAFPFHYDLIILELRTILEYLEMREYWNEWSKKYIAAFPANIYLFKFNNRYTRKRFEICSKLTTTRPEQRRRHSGIFVINFEQVNVRFLIWWNLQVFTYWILNIEASHFPKKFLIITIIVNILN